jgi:lipoate-protein ligase A
MSSEVETSLDIFAFRNSKRCLYSARNDLDGAPPLFASLNVYYDINSHSAAMNMAVDETLLENATVPTIRFYRWDHPALSFGYFGRYADVTEQQRDLVRRWTGGGIVFHGEDLTYSIVVPASDPAFGESSMSIYEKVHRALREALMARGERAELSVVVPVHDRRKPSSPEMTTVTDRRSSDNCFANPVRSDVLLKGRKIAGAAQRRTRRGLLHQGSIQNIDAGNDLAERFAKALSKKIDRREIDAVIVRRAQEIAGQKYGTEAWLRRR